MYIYMLPEEQGKLQINCCSAADAHIEKQKELGSRGLILYIQGLREKYFSLARMITPALLFCFEALPSEFSRDNDLFTLVLFF